MPAPTVTYLGSSVVDDDTAGESVAVTWSAGDRLLVLGMTEDQSRTFTGVPALTGFTFTALAGLPTAAGSSCKGYGWVSDLAASGGSGNVAVSGSAAGKSISVWRIAAGTSAGVVAATAVTSSALTVNVTRSQANSAIAAKFGDWNATADLTVDASPAGGTVRLADQYPGRYTDFAVDWGDQGAAGTSGYGISNATGTGTVTKVAVEILGTTGGARTGVAATTGGGQAAAAGRKTARAASATAGGGVTVGSGRKTARAAATSSGGGASVVVGRKGAVRAVAGTGAGGSQSSGRKTARSEVTATGGGASSATGTRGSAEARTGHASASGGGASSAAGRKTSRTACTSSSGGASAVRGIKAARAACATVGGGAAVTTGVKRAAGAAVSTGGGASTATASPVSARPVIWPARPQGWVTVDGRAGRVHAPTTGRVR